MFALTFMKLHGIFPPIATPFDHKGDLYKVKVQHNVEKWNQARRSPATWSADRRARASI